MATHARTHDAYTIGWVCALSKEQTAATAMLDERHPNLPKPTNDPNTYTFGSIGGHNIVIACLPEGKIGTNPAAVVASHMVHAFPAIRFGLMVGIGGGVPPKVRLGDVVVSVPGDQYSGVVQWDMGKAEQGGRFRRTGALNHPLTLLLTALTKLKTDHELEGSKISQYLEKLQTRYPRLAKQYLRSDSLQDVLFKASYGHVEKQDQDASEEEDDALEDDAGEDCRHCDKTQIVKRKTRDMRVHYGLIASGNKVIKDASVRDQVSKAMDKKVLCVEMEMMVADGSISFTARPFETSPRGHSHSTSHSARYIVLLEFFGVILSLRACEVAQKVGKLIEKAYVIQGLSRSRLFNHVYL